MPEDEQKELRDYFNNFIANEDDLGDCLFGEADEFSARLNMLGDKEFQDFANELVAKQVIDKDSLACE